MFDTLLRAAALTTAALALRPVPVMADPAESLTLRVTANGLRSDAGRVLCDLFRAGDGFPIDTAKAHLHAVAEPRERSATCVFEQLAPGKLAIAVMHDEDSDGRMKRNLVGIPREGWAVSNNAAAGVLGPPSYADAEFDLRTSADLELQMNY